MMQEQHAKIRIVGIRWHDEAPLHVGMAPRFQHQQLTVGVEIRADKFTLLENRLPENVRITSHDDSQWLACRVRIDCLHLDPIGIRFPVSSSIVPAAGDRIHRSRMGGIVNRQDNIPLFAAGFDVPVSLGGLFQRIASVNDRSQLARFDELA